ncbi:DEAD/DEAH box helicase, partial [Lysobacter sp. 2RAB21]
EYVRHNVNSADFTLAADLRVHLLRELNTIDLHSGAAALTDFQLDVWKALPEIRVGSISAPTSAGKSFVVIEYLCKRYIGAARLSGVYLAPTRALLGEVYGKLAAKLSDIPGLHISTVPAVAPAGTEKVLYVLTQERLSVLLSVSNISPNLLVIDEAQNIGDGARGMILQDCLERILDRDKNVQVVLLS